MQTVTDLLEVLKDNICEVTFTKKDGSQRTLICTQDMRRIPKEHHPKNEGVVEDVNLPPKLTTSVFDMDLEEWRSFTNANVIVWDLISDQQELFND